MAQGLRKFCTDGARCGLGYICENFQHREQSVEVVAMWSFGGQAGRHGECDYYIPRTELGSVNDMPRRAPGAPRHNEHVFPTQPRKKLILPEHLQKGPPDLQVSRHIKDGKNIKGNGDD